MTNSVVIPKASPAVRSAVPGVAVRTAFAGGRPKVFFVFGTRPEVIKLAPVFSELRRTGRGMEVIAVCSGQHTDLLTPLLSLFDFQPDFHLDVMQARQTPNDVCARVLERLAPIVAEHAPDLMIVQGDTTTALAGALTAFHHRIPVAHVEAGLRSGNPASPFPEEMNRRMITQLATFHFAATGRNRESLLQEGIAAESIFVTGNPVVDALHHIQNSPASAKVQELIKRGGGRKLIVLTTHRRENFGETMRGNLRALRRFIEIHEDVALVFPVHPNPNVVEVAKAELSGEPRILLVDPLNYSDFIHLLSHAWLVTSDSGGIQEEAPSLGKPLLVLRSNTERQEAIDSGAAVLVGDAPERLAALLEQAYDHPGWADSIKCVRNPFGDGTAATQIAEVLTQALCGAQRKEEIRR